MIAATAVSAGACLLKVLSPRWLDVEWTRKEVVKCGVSYERDAN